MLFRSSNTSALALASIYVARSTETLRGVAVADCTMCGGSCAVLRAKADVGGYVSCVGRVGVAAGSRAPVEVVTPGNVAVAIVIGSCSSCRRGDEK